MKSSRSSQGSFPYALVAPASRVGWVTEAGHPCKNDRRPIFTRAGAAQTTNRCAYLATTCYTAHGQNHVRDIVKESRRSTAVKATDSGRQDVSLWQSALQYGRPSLLPTTAITSHGTSSERANMMSQQLSSSSTPSPSFQKTVSSRAVCVASCLDLLPGTPEAEEETGLTIRVELQSASPKIPTIPPSARGPTRV